MAKRATGTQNRTETLDDFGFGGTSTTRANIFDDSCSNGTDFPYGQNAPQDSHDSLDSPDLQRPSLTLREKQRVHTLQSGKRDSSKEQEILAPVDFGDLASWVRTVYESLKEQPEPDAENWHSPLFRFARFVKAHPAVIGLCDYEATQKIEELMGEWLPRGSDCDLWGLFFPEADDGEAARLDFMTSWSGVRHVPFHDVLSNALRSGDEKPLRPPHPRGKLYQRFLSLAAWLQVLVPEKAILLPTRKLDKLLGCDQRTISRLRKLAVQDRLLVIVKAHSYRSGGGEATEFRFAIERYPGLAG